MQRDHNPANPWQTDPHTATRALLVISSFRMGTSSPPLACISPSSTASMHDAPLAQLLWSWPLWMMVITPTRDICNVVPKLARISRSPSKTRRARDRRGRMIICFQSLCQSRRSRRYMSTVYCKLSGRSTEILYYVRGQPFSRRQTF